MGYNHGPERAPGFAALMTACHIGHLARSAYSNGEESMGPRHYDTDEGGKPPDSVAGTAQAPIADTECLPGRTDLLAPPREYISRFSQGRRRSVSTSPPKSTRLGATTEQAQADISARLQETMHNKWPLAHRPNRATKTHRPNRATKTLGAAKIRAHFSTYRRPAVGTPTSDPETPRAQEGTAHASSGTHRSGMATKGLAEAKTTATRCTGRPCPALASPMLS